MAVALTEQLWPLSSIMPITRTLRRILGGWFTLTLLRMSLMLAADSPAPAAILPAGEPHSARLETPNLRLRAEAPTWPQLVAKVAPTLTWQHEDECDLLWISRDGRQFTVAPAFEYEPSAEDRATLEAEALGTQTAPSRPSPPVAPPAVRWVLLTAGERPSWAVDSFWAGKTAPEGMTVPLSDKIPSLDPDAGKNATAPDSERRYAVVRASDPRFGSVYEIGWPVSYDSFSGTVHEARLRRLFVLRDQAGQWRFLGEGPASGWIYGAGRLGTESRVEPDVAWHQPRTDEPAAVVRFNVTVTCKCFAGYDGIPDGADLEIHCQSVLGPTHFKADGSADSCTPVGRCFLVAGPGDNLDRMAARLAFWDPGFGLGWGQSAQDQAHKSAALQRWRSELSQLNPKLLPAAIPAGTHVEILTDEESAKIFFPLR